MFTPGRSATYRSVSADIARFHRERATALHCVPRIDGKIQQHLIELHQIGPNRGQAGCKSEHEGLLLGEGAPEQGFQLLYRRVEVDGLRLKDLSPAERQELAGDRGGSFRRLPDVLRVLPNRSGYIRPPQDELGGSEHHRHLVVGLVGHTAGQLAHHLDPFRVADPLLGALALR